MMKEKLTKTTDINKTDSNDKTLETQTINQTDATKLKNPGHSEKTSKEKTNEKIKEKIPKKKGWENNQAWKKGKKAIKPGRLSGCIPFEIHTADAQLYFSGYGSHETAGLLKFGGQMTAIWDASEKDDPYADWYLLKVYDAMIKLRNQLAGAIQDYQQRIHETYGRDNLSLTPFASLRPVVQSLWFRTQYGYLGANVIADFDLLMRTIHTAHRAGVLLDKPHVAIREEWGRKIADLFKLPFKWQAFNITRADIEADNEAAKAAAKLLGKLPERVLNKTLRSPFAPLSSITVDNIQPKQNEQKEQEEQESNNLIEKNIPQ